MESTTTPSTNRRTLLAFLHSCPQKNNNWNSYKVIMSKQTVSCYKRRSPIWHWRLVNSNDILMNKKTAINDVIDKVQEDPNICSRGDRSIPGMIETSGTPSTADSSELSTAQALIASLTSSLAKAKRNQYVPRRWQPGPGWGSDRAGPAGRSGRGGEREQRAQGVLRKSQQRSWPTTHTKRWQANGEEMQEPTVLSHPWIRMYRRVWQCTLYVPRKRTQTMRHSKESNGRLFIIQTNITLPMMVLEERKEEQN